jgi:hypothetical protein
MFIFYFLFFTKKNGLFILFFIGKEKKIKEKKRKENKRK